MNALNPTENVEDLILRLLREVTPGQFKKKEIRPDMLLQNDLGITSLEKVAIGFRLEEELGFEFKNSIKDIGEIRTVKDVLDIAKYIRERHQEASANQPTRNKQAKITSYQSLVAIQKSPFVAIRSDGVKPPFYACGHHPHLINLAQAVGYDQPFYKIDAYALLHDRMARGDKIDVHVEEMGNYFVQKILALQRDGPYFLGGGCEGALIAFEIAQQLESLGHRIAMLVIWDTATPEYWPNESARLVFLRRLRRLFSGGGTELKRRLSFLLDKATSVFTPRSEERSNQDTHIEHVLMRTAKRYVTKSYSGNIILFRASESEVQCSDPTMGWGPVANRGVDIRILPGNHTTYFEQNFSTFVETLKICLAQAQTSPQLE